MLVNEENVVLEAGVEMRLKTQLADDWVVVAVDVCVNTVHPLEDGANGRWECPWERNAWQGLSALSRTQVTDSFTIRAWEDGLVVNVALNPSHQVLNVGWSWHLRWTLEVLRILPQILELVGGLHLWARLWRAELGDGSVEQVNVVVEVDHY